VSVLTTTIGSTLAPPLTAGKRRWRREALYGIAFTAPAFALLVAIVLAPLATLVALSFTDYELGAVTTRWVGLDNFRKALGDPCLPPRRR
jgi:multiple sugar transport system permease protein